MNTARSRFYRIGVQRLSCAAPLLYHGETSPREEDGMIQGGGPGGGNDPLQGLEVYEQMVDTFAEQAKLYWRMWGPQGEPVIRGIDAWAEMQRAYVQWLRQNMGNQP